MSKDANFIELTLHAVASQELEEELKQDDENENQDFTKQIIKTRRLIDGSIINEKGNSHAT